MTKFLLVCIIMYFIWKYLKALVNLAGFISLTVLVSYGMMEYGDRIINYIQDLGLYLFALSQS